MQGPTVQLITLACHFNALVDGFEFQPIFPSNSSFQFCEYVRFACLKQWPFGIRKRWATVAETPDHWLRQDATRARRAILVHHSRVAPPISDRMSAGFVGGGGRWLLAITSGQQAEFWESAWEVGDGEAADRRIWRVTYGLVAKDIVVEWPNCRSLSEIRAVLRATLREAIDFAFSSDLRYFAERFQTAIECLHSDSPTPHVYHRDLAPEGYLSLAASQMLAACQSAWVFGGMGSWNDCYFEGDKQTHYEELSDRLYKLLIESVCASVLTTVKRENASAPARQ